MHFAPVAATVALESNSNVADVAGNLQFIYHTRLTPFSKKKKKTNIYLNALPHLANKIARKSTQSFAKNSQNKICKNIKFPQQHQAANSLSMHYASADRFSVVFVF